ncbi:hypothetical protein [Halorientalis salina]|uniref:hypothetical protein n=1 Tax=Halorientalis salina TaxID=2932266 RepID=UPI0010AC18B8|nr:hypothetical protein [Halorientalis salina]
MATRAPSETDTNTIDLSPAVPSDLSALTRMSSDLGRRLVEGEETTSRGEWSHTETARELSIHHATDNTVILRMRTPVGRERFYGAMQSNLDAAISSLDVDPDWERQS